MHLDTLSEIVYNFTTSGAVVIGGVWAYFKFIRGRTFSHRAELSITAVVENYEGRIYLSVTIALKNTGLSKLPINDEMKYIQLYGMTSGGVSFPGSVDWDRLLTKRMFEQHAWVEAQETAIDTIVFRLQDAGSQSPGHPAYQVEVWLGAPRNHITRKGCLWHARAVAFMPSAYTENKAAIPPSGNGLFERILNRRSGYERVR
jgi:hypothetical protein